MTIQSTCPIQSIFQQSQEQPNRSTLWNQLSPEQQKQVAQRLAELVQRIRSSLPLVEKESHENQ
jgi:hypothetical protein